MLDRNALADDLTEGFIRYQYRLEHPMPTPHETFNDMEVKYRHDPIFRNRVQSLVSGVMQIVDKHLGRQTEGG